MNFNGLILSGLMVGSSCLMAQISIRDKGADKEFYGTATEKTSLTVGEQRPIHLGTPSRVNVSRRGVIHLIETGPGLWRITGLRAGVVALELHQRGGGRKVIYIDVLPKPPPSHANRQPSTEALPATTEELSPKKFEVKAHIELMEEQNSEITGGPPEGSVAVDLVSGKMTPKVLGNWESRDRRYKRRVLGEPLFTVHEDDDAVVKSGGESLQDRTDEDGRHRDVWHEYGMSLSVKLHERPDHLVTGDILFELKNPGSDARSFSLNHIQTKTSLRFGEKTRIGSVDLASHDQGEDKNSLLSQVPIIGPLFKRNTDTSAKALVELWLEINEVGAKP